MPAWIGLHTILGVVLLYGALHWVPPIRAALPIKFDEVEILPRVSPIALLFIVSAVLLIIGFFRRR